MRIARLRLDDEIAHVRHTDAGWIRIEDPYTAFAAGRAPLDGGADVVQGELLPAADARVVIGIAQNGPDHPSPVQAWLKNPRTLIASGRTVRLRRDAGTPVAEGEITVVLGRDLSGLTRENAHEYVLGITAVNDLSSPDRGEFDPRNFESKSGEGYTPLGPWIDTEASIDDVHLELDIDGETVTRTGSADLPVSIRDCLVYLAHWAPLGAGDVIMTGAPFTNRPIGPGARVTVRVGSAELVTPTE